jgi:hypothetical protein
LHAHFIHDSLPGGIWCFPLLTLVMVTVALRLYCRPWRPFRHLHPPLARAPPFAL